MKKYLYILMAVLTLATFASCDDGNDLSTQQFLDRTNLNAFGPCPVARGGQLRFVGTNMNTVTSVVFPGGTEVTEINKISDKEICVTVPQTAEVGIIELKTSTGDLLRTASEVTYLEPISLEKFSPAKVKAGDLLTIEGDYLNLMNGVVFAEGDTVKVLEEHSRHKIVVRVPETAQTGKLAVTDLADDPNVIESEGVLEVVLPAVAKVEDLTGRKPGDEITQEGTDLDLVSKLQIAGKPVSFVVSAGKKITYTLPEDTPDAAEVAIFPASGVKVVIATIGMVIPSELKATPAEKLWAGDKLTITGQNLDVVASLSFPGVGDAVQADAQSATELTVTVPEGTQSGDLVLNLKSGQSVTVAISTLKPSLRGFAPNPVAANSQLTLKGTNLHIVAKIVFKGVAPVEVSSADGKQILVTVPTMAESGMVKLILSNGEEIDAKELTVLKPESAYAVDPEQLKTSEEKELRAGEIIAFEIENADRLTGVLVDGQECQYILNGKSLFVLTPASAGKKSVITLVSDNGQIEYALSVIANGEKVTVLWSGASELSWSGEGQIYLGDDGGQSLIDADAAPGDILRIKFAPTADDWCFQLWEGHWGTMYAEVHPEDYDLAGNNNCYFIELTADLLSTFTSAQGWGSIVLVQGQQLIVTELALIQKGGAAETTLWEGELIADDWANQPYALSDAGQELIDAEAKAGQTVNFYLTPLEPAWKLEILEGHWGPSYGAWTAPGEDTENGKFQEYDLGANGGKVSIKLTQEMLDAALTQQWWGGVFVLNGDNVKCTKITLE